MKLKLKLLIFISLQILINQGFPVALWAQIIKGKVVSEFDNQPLPFVRVTYSSDKRSTVSNIEGWFSVPDTVSSIRLSFVGYQDKNIHLDKLGEKELLVRMNPSEKEILPITESPQNNPALKIMKKAVEYREHNDPEKYNSYQYTSLQKFNLSSISLTGNEPLNSFHLPDTLKVKAKTPSGGNSIFTMEILGKNKMLKPDHVNEEMISAKVTGTGKKPYILLANQLQSLSVYDEYFTVWNKSYLSPVSLYGLKKYYYALTDTFLTERNDTVFVIRFNPVKRNTRIGLKGVLYINKHGNAVQAINAESAEKDPNAAFFSIKEQFDLLPDGKWFPGEKSSVIRFGLKKTDKKNSTLWHIASPKDKIVAVHHISLYQREINPPLKPADFPKYDITTNPNPKEATEETIQPEQKRAPEEINILPRIPRDSVAEAKVQESKAKLIRLLAEGKIPVGYFNINYDRLFSYNLYEGIKAGVGAESNRRLSRYFTVGGYITYGLKDKSIRQGEWFDIYPKGYYDFRVHLGYKDMNMEFGEPEFLEKKSLLNPEFFRNLLIENMYSTKRYSAGLEVRPFRELNTYIFGDLSDNSARKNNPFLLQHTFQPFRLVRAGLELRYSPGITFIEDPDMLIENTTPKSDWFFNVIQGINLFQGQYNYTKMEFKGKFHFRLSPSSVTSILLRAGHITDHAPLTEFFNGYGSYVSSFSLVAQNSFTTMRQNEFCVEDFSAIFLRHNLGTWFLPEGHRFSPDFVLAQNIGFGSLNASNSTKFGLGDFRKGYYESGFEINNLFRMDFISFGLGVYYRYGPYRLPDKSDNFAYKFGFLFKL